MSYWPDDIDHRRDGVYIPTIGVTIALSVLLHLAVIWQWKFQLREPPPDKDIPPPLTVKLAPLPGPPPTPAPAFVPPPVSVPLPRAAREAPPPVAVRPPPAAPPPVIARNPPTPVEPAVPAPAPPRAAPAVDFASFIEAQRRARGESATAPPAAPPVEDENARATRLAIANLATQKAQPLGYDPSHSGGVFQIRSKSIDYAEFMFFGWHKDARRDLQQLVEVRKGNNSTIELAVVRKMIEIVRTYEQADFTWQSHRLRRSVTLSARQRDSAELEEFLMREFFYNPRIAP